jgi:hypothetical protein
MEVVGKLGHRPETALIHLGLAELEQLEGNSDEARAHLDACIPELEAMKMRPALERALALREMVGAPRGERP